MKIATRNKTIWSGLPVLLFVMLAVPSICSAQLTLDFGTIESGMRFVDLLPDTAGQEVQFFASGTSDVTFLGDGDNNPDTPDETLTGVNGFELALQVGDGGAALGGTDVGPTISNVDLVFNSIFNSDDVEQADPRARAPLAIIVGVSNVAGSNSNEGVNLVTDDGLVATVTFDTTGLFDGNIDLTLFDIGDANNTFFLGDTTEFTPETSNAIIRIGADVVPEPSSVVLVAGFGLVGLVQRRRRQNS